MTPIIPQSLPEPAAAFENVFSAQQLDWLESLACNADKKGDTAGGNTRRRSKVCWLDLTPETQPFYRHVADFIAVVNARFWRFDLTALAEQMQLARYEMGDTYDWHQDFGSMISSRKLSITVQLTDPAAYDGGKLEIMKAGDEVVVANSNRGAATVFPSYQLHRVSPVTRGVRHSLVAWVSGPAFR